jgi:hypothetical protein
MIEYFYPLAGNDFFYVGSKSDIGILHADEGYISNIPHFPLAF